jgi:methylglutaconyl-CoA hydratase
MQGHVTTHNEHGITTIEFFNPQSNSLSGEIIEKLSHEIHFAGTHDETKVIILKSAGDNVFCSGANFDELTSITNETQGIRFFSAIGNIINAMRKCHKIIIGRIHGKCIGGGLGIAAAADYAMASDKAEVRLSELTLGIGPFVVGPALERKMGISAFSQLALDAAHWRSADWAKRKGLFAEVHTSPENLDEAIYRLATSLAHYSIAALSEMKKILWKGTEHWDELLKERAAISGRLVLSEFTKSAISKFKVKAK